MILEKEHFISYLGNEFGFPFFGFGNRELQRILPNRRREENSPTEITREFDELENKVLKVIDRVINQNISTSITQQSQQIKDTVAQCLQIAEQSLATVLNSTAT